MLGKAKNIWTRTWSMARAVAQAAFRLPSEPSKRCQRTLKRAEHDEDVDLLS